MILRKNCFCDKEKKNHFNSRITPSVRNELLWALQYVVIALRCKDFRNYSARMITPKIKMTIVVHGSFLKVPAMKKYWSVHCAQSFRCYNFVAFRGW